MRYDQPRSKSSTKLINRKCISGGLDAAHCPEILNRLAILAIVRKRDIFLNDPLSRVCKKVFKSCYISESPNER
jgi:hypothetical protein